MRTLVPNLKAAATVGAEIQTAECSFVRPNRDASAPRTEAHDSTLLPDRSVPHYVGMKVRIYFAHTCAQGRGDRSAGGRDAHVFVRGAAYSVCRTHKQTKKNQLLNQASCCFHIWHAYTHPRCVFAGEIWRQEVRSVGVHDHGVRGMCARLMPCM